MNQNCNISVVYENFGCEIYFARHAQSMANIGCEWMIDSPLSEKGIRQAKQMEGHFDLVLCSPCRRTKETLHYSKVTFDKVVFDNNCREMVQTPTSQLLMEQRNDIFRCEDISNFWARSSVFQRELEEKCRVYHALNIKAKILIISHGFFFNAWYRRGCYRRRKMLKYSVFINFPFYVKIIFYIFLL